MNRAFILIPNLVFLVWIMGGCSSTFRGKTAMDKIEGKWECQSAVVNGKPLPESTTQLLRLTLEGGRYRTQKGSEVLFDSTYRVDPSREPKEISMVGTEGELRGKEAQGIYQLKGDTLTICYTMPGKQRPATFESQVGAEAYLIVWRRAAAQ